MLTTEYEKADRPLKLDASRIAAHSDTGLFFGGRDVDAAYAYLREKG